MTPDLRATLRTGLRTSLRQAARWAGLPDGDPILDALLPLVTHRALEPVDLHVALMLAARLEERDPAVIVAAALAVRAPRFGHVCVDLARLESDALLPEGRSDEPVALGLPVDRDAWRDRVAQSPLVRPPGPGDTPLVLRGDLLYTDRYFAYEARLHEALGARFAAARPVADPGLLRRGLDALFPASSDGLDRQRLAAAMALLRGATVISGGPGTGKTWTVRNLLTLLYAQAVAGDGEPPRIALAAPTGKAAARVVESIRAGLSEHLARASGALPPGADPAGLQSFLEDVTPSTLHRLLGWRPDAPTRFRHDRERPLPLDVVIVDEASMVDLALMAKLVDAVPPHALLVLLGDRHQLASVEAGSVLADLCGPGADGTVRLSEPASAALSEVAALEVAPSEAAPGPWDGVVFLTASRRFHADSGIGRFARAAVAGQVDEAVAALPAWPDGQPGPLTLREGRVIGRDLGRIGHVARGLPAAARRLIVEGYRPYLEALRSGPAAPGPEALAAHHAEVLRLFEGFRVLCAHRRGRYGVEGLDEVVRELLVDEGLVHPSGAWWVGRPILVTSNDYTVGRFNGDVGMVVRDADGEPVVAFADDGGGVAWLAPVRLPAHETVFAMTIHKSQGSEFDDVLVVLPEQPSPVLTRELVYTGVTRARHRVTVLGGEPVLRGALGREVQRASGLAGVLWRRA